MCFDFYCFEHQQLSLAVELNCKYDEYENELINKISLIKKLN